MGTGGDNYLLLFGICVWFLRTSEIVYEHECPNMQQYNL